jgi:hypothetical protein
VIDHEEVIFKTLTGKYKHYCPEWDFMAIDEFSPEFEACLCYNQNVEDELAPLEEAEEFNKKRNYTYGK